MVVFEDGAPRKSEYRRFIIKSFEGNDDFAAMDEVLTRRLQHLDANSASADPTSESQFDVETGKPKRFAYAPSLIVVDGGAPQVSAVQRVLDKLELPQIALCGLAKRLEEVWLPGEEYPVILPRNSEGLYLLQRLRDEAHRFAITHHRARRGKAMLESVLDEIPGLGEKRKQALLKSFGSVAKLRKTSAEDLATIPGIGEATARSIVSALADSAPPSGINMTTGEIV
jgi:excinuclease ABC subunit C